MGPELKPTIPPLGTTTRKGLCSFQGASGKQGCQTIVLAGALRRPDPPRSNNLLISLGNEICPGKPPPLFPPPACLPPVPILKGGGYPGTPGVHGDRKVAGGKGEQQANRARERGAGARQDGAPATRTHGNTEHRPRGRSATRSTGHANPRNHGNKAHNHQTPPVGNRPAPCRAALCKPYATHTHRTNTPRPDDDGGP